VLRAAEDPEALVGGVRERVRAIDAKLPLQRVATLETTLGAGLARRRFSTFLLTLFATLAMLLAAIGIYGLLSYWVTVRESEIAIRLALGARPSTIVRWTGLHALRLTAIGVAAGLLGGWAAAGTLGKLVYGIPASNPAMMFASAVAVTLIAVAAAQYRPGAPREWMPRGGSITPEGFGAYCPAEWRRRHPSIGSGDDGLAGADFADRRAGPGGPARTRGSALRLMQNFQSSKVSGIVVGNLPHKIVVRSPLGYS
jgi:hypothetical protein